MTDTKIATPLRRLMDAPPWEWPADAAALLLRTLRDERASDADRGAAASLAGDAIVVNEELAEALVATVASEGTGEEVRATAAVSLGPLLETCDIEGFDDPLSDLPISEATYRRLLQSLRSLHGTPAVPQLVRRKVLEAAVRAPQEWHADAIRTAYASEALDWKLTAVFCMGYVQGFEPQILAALDHPDAGIQREAVIAAGQRELDEAWPHVRALVRSASTPKPLLLAAIEAVANIRPGEAADELSSLARSRDGEIVEAVEEALAIAEVAALGDDDV
jgi:hypothetical protein